MKKSSTKKPKIKKEVVKKIKFVPTEAELVKKYANRVIKNQIYHGRVDASKFAGMEHTHAVNKNLWMDADFYFCVVFESADQKYEFLKLANWSADSVAENQVQIVNGIKLAERLGLSVKRVTSKEFPSGNLDLLPFVLDNEEV